MPRDELAWVVDVAQLLGAIIGVIAIVLAVLANRSARRAETRSRDALVRERRIDFQLDLLKELGEFNLRGSNVSFATNEFTLRARLLPVDLAPLARAAVNLDSTPEARALVEARKAEKTGNPPRDLLRKEIDAEIVLAINRLLAERHSGDIEQRPSRWLRLWQRVRSK